jgi:replicative DNA helicase
VTPTNDQGRSGASGSEGTDFKKDRASRVRGDGGSAIGHVHTDVWEQSLTDWLPVRVDVATREHFRAVERLARKGVKTAAGRRGIATGDWILEAPEKLPVVWGTQEAPLAVEGEGLMIAGPQGVGKTTIAQQLTLALAGVRAMCLGLPVRPEHGRVLYLAMDRPEQIRRSFARMVTEDDRVALHERVVFWRGHLDFSVTEEPERVAQFALEHGASAVVVDSYKDIAFKLSDEEVGSLINKAVQVCVSEGLLWIGVHHDRKATSENKHPNDLSDVFGSNWLTAGLGSVLHLYGEPGAEHVEAKHLKQPAETMGAFGIRHDHERGVSEIVSERPVTDGRKKGKAGNEKRVQEYLRDHPDASAAEVKRELKLTVDERTVRRYMAEVRGKAAEDGFVDRVGGQDNP